MSQVQKIQKNPEIHAYLAGPDVFSLRAAEIGDYKKKILAQYGIIGHFPTEGLPENLPQDPKQASLLIYENCEKMMLSCIKQGQIALIIANMNPFHGPSMDIGTSFEMGFMYALSLMNEQVGMVGYTEDPRNFEQRVQEDYYNLEEQRQIAKDPVTGLICAPDGHFLEAFNMADNLMVCHSISKTGGQILSTFEEAADYAAQLAQHMIESMRSKRNGTE